MTRLANQWTRAARRRLLPAAALLALPLGACGLDVTDPAIVQPTQLNTPEALPSLRAGAIFDFKTAYSGTGGNQEGIILAGGLRADEYRNSDTFDTRQEIDRGLIFLSNGNNQTLFRDMQQARLSAEFAAGRYASLDAAQGGYGETLNLAGFTYVLFAEHYCSGVPFSEYDLETRDITYGAPQTTAQILQLAVARFDSALASATGRTATSAVARSARVGKARALLDAGQFAAAAALVTPALVPTSFAYVIEHSENTPEENNGVYFLNNINRRWSVPDTAEGRNGIDWRRANDPRVPVAAQLSGGRVRVGLDNRTPMYVQFKYPSRSAPIPLATGIEARLIEAEAALRAGDVATFTAKHNELRADRTLYACPTVATPNYTCPTANLAPLVTAGLTAEQLTTLHFRERAFWLFSTGHRLGDLRRLVRQYGRPFASVYPQGVYPKGGQPYGNFASLPVPVDERNNALYRTDACDPTQP